MSNALFLKASRKKLRFSVKQGFLSTEDLWDLSLPALDAIAVGLDEVVQKQGRKSFIATTKTAEQNDDSLRFEIVKQVIDIRLAEEAARKARAQTNSQKSFLKELLEKKRVAALEGLSAEEIQAQIDQLDGAESVEEEVPA